MFWKTVLMVRQFWILGPMPKNPDFPTEKAAPTSEILSTTRPFGSKMSPLELLLLDSESS